jgi:hypothetical protein
MKANDDASAKPRIERRPHIARAAAAEEIGRWSTDFADEVIAGFLVLEAPRREPAPGTDYLNHHFCQVNISASLVREISEAVRLRGPSRKPRR